MYRGYRTIECLANAERTPTVIECDAPILRNRVYDARVKMRFADFLAIKARMEKLTSEYYAAMGQYSPAYKAREKRLAKKVADLAFDMMIYS